jgi:hypothetical protein
MSRPFLTMSGSERNDRRAAACLMTALMLSGVGASGVRAEEPTPPPSLIARALQRNGERERPNAGGRMTYARLVPELRLIGIVQQAQAPARASVDNILMAQLSWPLDQVANNAIAATRDARQRAAARESLVARILEAWHRRQDALDRADDLAAEEADAELDAVTGEIDP